MVSWVSKHFSVIYFYWLSFFFLPFCIFFVCFLYWLLKVFLGVPLVGQEPDIPDLIDYMQSGDETRIINAAGYLQHLCYSKENVKDKVRYLGGLLYIII